MNYPGYFWLANDWDNFMFSCQICNQRFKQNYFPLKNPMERAVFNNRNIKNEKALLINPTTEDPENYITFRKAFIKTKNKSTKGTISIKLFGLKRHELWEKRNTIYKLISTLINSIKKNPNNSEAIKKLLKDEYFNSKNEYFNSKNEYFGMIKANFKNHLKNLKL